MQNLNPNSMEICRKLGRRTFFIFKKNFMLALMIRKTIGFKFFKNAKKVFQPPLLKLSAVRFCKTRK